MSSWKRVNNGYQGTPDGKQTAAKFRFNDSKIINLSSSGLKSEAK